MHSIAIVLEGVAEDYTVTEDHRALIIRYASETIEELLEPPVTLVKVEYAFDDRRLLASTMLSSKGGTTTTSNDRRRRLASVSVPLKVFVRGPTNFSDFTLSFVMDTLKSSTEVLESKLKEDDWENFKDVSVSEGTYDAETLTKDPTRSPTARPTAEPTRKPTKRPTKKPTKNPTESPTPFPTPETEEVVHPVRLVFKNIPRGKRLSVDDRKLVIQFVYDMLNGQLDERLELLDISYPGILIDKSTQKKGGGKGVRRLLHSLGLHQGGRELNNLGTHSLPLLIRVKTPIVLSEISLAIMMDVFDNIQNMLDLCGYVMSLKWIESLNCGVVADSYDISDIVAFTDVPTGSPTPGPISVEKDVPVQFIFQNVPAGYTWLSETRDSLLRFVEVILVDNLDEQIKLVDVSHAGLLLATGASGKISSVGGRDRSPQSMKGVFAPRYPLLITVSSPPDIADFAEPYILQILEDNLKQLENYMLSLDDRVFKDPGLFVDMFSLEDISDASKMETTEHPVQLTFNSLPAGYSFSPQQKASLLWYIEDLLGNNLAGAFELIDASYADETANIMGGKGRSLQSGANAPPSLPFLFKVRGPEDLSEYAQLFIIQVLRDNMEDIEDFLKTLDEKAFVDPDVAVAPYDAPEPTLVRVEDPPTTRPWWFWFLLGIGTLFLICCSWACTKYLCVYKKQVKEDPRKYDFDKRDTRSVGGPLVIDRPTPFIVEKPILVEKAPERRKKHKKRKKKRKKERTEISVKQLLQIEPQKEYDGPMIAFPNYDEPTAQSLVTFEGMDPPSRQLLIEGPDPSVVMSVSPHYARLLPPAERSTSSSSEEQLELYDRPDGYNDQYDASHSSASGLFSYSGGSEKLSSSPLELRSHGESQSFYGKEPSVLGLDDGLSRSRNTFTREPSGLLGWDAGSRASQSHAGRSHASRSHAGRSHASRSHASRSHASRSHYTQESRRHLAIDNASQASYIHRIEDGASQASDGYRFNDGATQASYGHRSEASASQASYGHRSEASASQASYGHRSEASASQASYAHHLMDGGASQASYGHRSTGSGRSQHSYARTKESRTSNESQYSNARTKEPSGHEWDHIQSLSNQNNDEHSSRSGHEWDHIQSLANQHQGEMSFSTQSPEDDERSAETEGGDFAPFDDPSFSEPGSQLSHSFSGRYDVQKVPRRKGNQSSGGISSEDSYYDPPVYESHPPQSF